MRLLRGACPSSPLLSPLSRRDASSSIQATPSFPSCLAFTRPSPSSRYRRDHTRTGFYLYVIENPFIRPSATYRPGRIPHNLHQIEPHSPLTSRSFPCTCDRLTSCATLARRELQDALRRRPAGPRPLLALFEYADAMANARFSLCPRGICAGSIRLFESMKMGRACVIISDAWQPNDGVDWDSFLLRVPEAEVHRLPAILEEHADRAAEMGPDAQGPNGRSGSPRKSAFTASSNSASTFVPPARSPEPPPQVLRHAAHPLHPRMYLRSKRILYRRDGRLARRDRPPMICRARIRWHLTWGKTRRCGPSGREFGESR